MRRPSDDPAPLDGFGFDLPEDEWLARVRESVGPVSSLGRIGEYEVLEEISRGGQGVVFRARQPRTGRVVALKRLLAGSFATPRGRQRFEREMEITARLQHPGIVTLHGMEVIDGQPTFAMEWIDGIHIDRWAAGEPDGAPRSVSEILRLFVDVARAVHHAHQRGVLHRDLKPANILVDRDGRPHVLDFGVAKLLQDEEEQPLTRTEEFMGSPAYAPPEQLRDGAGAVDVRGDVYALGVNLYVLLARRLPYDHDLRVLERLAAIESHPPPPASSFRSGLDPEVDTILAMAMAAEPDLRYPSVDAFAADLERHLDGRPILAHPPSTLYHVRKLVRRNRPLVALAIAAVVMLIGFAVHAQLSALRLERERNRAVSVLDYLRRGVFGAMDPYLTGRRVDLKQILAAATDGLDDRFASESDVRLELLEVLGRAKHQLGDVTGAVDDLRRVERALAADPDAEPGRLARARTGLAGVLADRSEFATADTLLAQAEAELRPLGADVDALLVEALTSRVGIDLTLDRFEDAAGKLEEIDALVLRAEGPEAPRRLRNRLMRARLEIRQQRFDAAKVTLDRLLPVCIRRLGERDPLVTAVKRQLGVTLAGLGRIDESGALLEEVLEERQRLFGDHHPEVAQVLVDLASARVPVMRDDGAERMLRRAIEIFQDSGAGEHEAVAQAYGTLADQLAQLGEFDEAERLLTRALALLRERRGPEHPAVANLLTSLGSLCSMRGEYDRARRSFEEATEIRLRVLGPRHLDVAHGLNGLALNAKMSGDLESAERHYGEALDVLRGVDNASWKILVVLNNIANLRLMQRDDAGAREVFQESLDLARAAHLEFDHVDCATAARGVARVSLGLMDHARAEPLFRELIEHPESYAGREWWLGHDLIGLGVAISSQGKLTEGMALLDRAVAELEALGDHAPPDLMSEARNVRRLIEAQLTGEAVVTPSPKAGPEAPNEQ